MVLGNIFWRKEMKLIIAGSRTITDYDIVKMAFNNFKFKDEITEIVEGGARGIDALGRRLGEEFNIPVTTMTAKWNRRDGSVDKTAGYKRNAEMAKYADMLLAIWDFESRGTKHMIEIANNNEMYTEIYNRNGVRVSQNRYW